ncbi:MAG: hypothetical protein IPQ07_42150 [Myxococcales bacterium]|nr:hypothetical protein [Myxococcales bacterium]
MRTPVTVAAVLVAAIALTGTKVTAEDRQPLVVEVGKTVSTKVGFAMGHLCDDETIVRAEMQNGTTDDNLFVVTGLKPGTTLCRAGVVEDRPTVLFEITVTAKKRAR